jgi:hypothetical protein
MGGSFPKAETEKRRHAAGWAEGGVRNYPSRGARLHEHDGTTAGQLECFLWGKAGRVGCGFSCKVYLSFRVN